MIPLNTLAAARFEQLCTSLQVEEAGKGMSLFRQGDPRNEYVYLLSGTISLEAGGVEMDTITGGTDAAHFALAHQIPRKVSAIAKDRVRYVRINPELLVREEPREEVLGFTLNEMSEGRASKDDDWLSIILRSPLFQRLPPANLQNLLRTMEEVPVEAGYVVMRQDDPGDYYYVIKKGQCVLTRKPSKIAKEVKLATLKAGDSFGEDSLISERPRTVTITMSTDGILLRLDKANFLKYVKEPVVSLVELKTAREMVENGAEWLDVRMPDEYEQFRIPGSRNAPFFSLRMFVSNLDRNKKFILVCEDGKLSEAAAFLFRRHGLQSFVLSGGIKNYPQSEYDRGATLEVFSELQNMDGRPSVQILDMPFDLDYATQSNFELDEPARFGDQEASLATIPARLSQFLEEEEGHNEEEVEPAPLAIAPTPPAIGEAELRVKLQSLQHEVDELRCSLGQANNARQSAEREAENQAGKVKELQIALAGSATSGGSKSDEAQTLRNELDKLRQRSEKDIKSIQGCLLELEMQRDQLLNERDALCNQIAVRDAAVAAEGPRFMNKWAEQPSWSLFVAWPLAISLVLATLILASLFILEPGRQLLRGWLQ